MQHVGARVPNLAHSVQSGHQSALERACTVGDIRRLFLSEKNVSTVASIIRHNKEFVRTQMTTFIDNHLRKVRPHLFQDPRQLISLLDKAFIKRNTTDSSKLVLSERPVSTVRAQYRPPMQTPNDTFQSTWAPIQPLFPQQSTLPLYPQFAGQPPLYQGYGFGYNNYGYNESYNGSYNESATDLQMGTPIDTSHYSMGTPIETMDHANSYNHSNWQTAPTYGHCQVEYEATTNVNQSVVDHSASVNQSVVDYCASVNQSVVDHCASSKVPCDKSSVMTALPRGRPDSATEDCRLYMIDHSVVKMDGATENFVEVVRSEERKLERWPHAQHFQVDVDWDHVIAVDITSVAFDKPDWNVSTLNNKLYYAELDNPMECVMVPPKFYSIEELLDYLTNAMNEKSQRFVYKWTLDNGRRIVVKATVLSGQCQTDQFSLLFEQTHHTIHSILGFRKQNYVGKIEYIAESKWSLGSPTAVQIWSDEFAADRALLTLPLDSTSDRTITFTFDKPLRVFQVCTPRKFSRLTMRLKDVEGTQFVMPENHEFKVEMTVTKLPPAQEVTMTTFPRERPDTEGYMSTKQVNSDKKLIPTLKPLRI